MSRPSLAYITRLRFPLALAVVFIHAMGAAPRWQHASELSLLDACKWLFSQTLAGVAVPTFFFLSGYLFFLGMSEARVTWAFFLAKWKRRLLTLLLPYLTWNVLAFLWRWGESGWGAFAARWERKGGFDIFWSCHAIGRDHSNAFGLPLGHLTAPLDVPLWFLRDLMLTILLAPVLYALLRHRGVGLMVLGLAACCYVLGIWPHPAGLSLTAPFLFSVGATFSLHRHDPVQSLRPFRFPVWGLSAVLLLFPLLLRGTAAEGLLPYSAPLATLVSLPAVLLLAGEFDHRDVSLSSRTRWLAQSSFLIYAAHTVGLLRQTDLLLRALLPTTQGFWGVVHYFLLPLLTTLLCLLLFALLSPLYRWSAPFTGIWPKSPATTRQVTCREKKPISIDTEVSAQ